MTRFSRIGGLLLTLTLLLSHAAAAGPLQRYTLIVGANSGGDDRPRLRYAVSDAERVAQVLGELGGVDRADGMVLRDPKVREFMDALAQLGARVAASRAAVAQAGGRTEVVFYYSGHADEKGLLLGDDRVSYQTLRDRLDDIRADVRIAVLDACASGAFTRIKGGRKRPPFIVNRSASMQGHAFLTSSSATEAAQESDRIRASYFTHYLVSGFRGAADSSGDGQVTLNEAYQFAFTETVGRTVDTRGGAQHPSYDINLTGAGDVVMTDVRQHTAALVLDGSIEGRVYVRSAASQSLVAELYKPRGRRVELALEPGGFEIRVEADKLARSTRVTIADGARAVLQSQQLGMASAEPTRSRGQDDIAPFSVAGRNRLSMTAGGWGNHGGVGIAGRNLDVVSGAEYTWFLRENLSVALGVQGFGAEAAQGIVGGWALPIALRWNPVPGDHTSRRLKPFLSAGALPVTQIESMRYALGIQVGGGADVFLSRSFSITGSALYNGFPLTGVNHRRDDFKGLQVSLGFGWMFGAARVVP